MGSVDLPPFVRQRMKEQQQGGGALPPFVKKKEDGIIEPSEDLNNGTSTSAPFTFASQGSNLNNLDEVEKQEFSDANGFIQPAQAQEQLASNIISKRNDPVTKYNRAKQFISQDIDNQKANDLLYPSFIAQSKILKPDFQKMKPDIIDDGEFNVDGQIPSIQYTRQRQDEIDSQILDLKNQLYVPVNGDPTNTLPVLPQKYNEIQNKIEELSAYKQRLTDYADPIAKVQVYKNVKATPKANPYLDMGINFREISSPIEAENKKKDIADGTDLLKHKERLAIENYGYEADGLNIAMDAAAILKANGQITDDEYKSEIGKVIQAQAGLDKKYPEVRLKNIKNAIGQIVDRNRDIEIITKPGYGDMKSLWNNIVSGAPTDAEINEAIKELNSKGANLTTDEAKTILNSADIGNTALIGRTIGGIANLSNKLASFAGLQSEATRENVDYVIKQDFANTPNKADFQPQQIVSTEGTAKTNPEFLKPIPNPEAGMHNWGWGTLNTVADGIGMVAKFALLTKGVGAVADVALGGVAGTEAVGYGVDAAAGRIAARTALSEAQKTVIGTIGGTYIDTYHSFYDASKQIIGEEQGGEKARELYANTMGILNGLAWTILPANKIVRDIIGQSKTVGAQKFAELISKEGLNGVKENTLKDFIVNTLTETAKAQGKMEAISAITQIADYAAQAAFNPQSVDGRNLGQELMDGAIHGLSFLPVTLLEGRGLARNIDQINDVHKAAIFRVATDPASFKSFADKEVDNGVTTPLDRDRKVQLVNTAAQILREIPQEFNKEDQLQYGSNLLLIRKLNAQKEKLSDETEIGRIDKKVKQLNQANDKLYNTAFPEEKAVEPNVDVSTVSKVFGEKKTEEPIKEQSAPTVPGEPADISQPIDLNPNLPENKPLIERAKELVNSDVVKGYSAEPLKEAANNNPEDFNGFLSEIAQQAHDEQSANATERTYGKELVDIAKELFPQKESAPVEPSVSINKKSVEDNLKEIAFGYDDAELKRVMNIPIENIIEEVNSRLSNPNADLRALPASYENRIRAELAAKGIETTSKTKISEIKDEVNKLSEKQSSPSVSIENKNEVAPDEIKKINDERDAELEKVRKPDIKLNLVSAKELVDSKDPIGNKEKHNAIKEKFKELKKILACL